MDNILDFSMFNEREKEVKKIRKEVRAIFNNHIENMELFDNLQKEKIFSKHVEVFKAIYYNMDLEKFNDFIRELIENNLMFFGNYDLVFQVVMNEFNNMESPLFRAIIELDDYIIPVDISEKLKFYISAYINRNGMDISIHRFQDFKHMTKRVKWDELIKYTIFHGNFGNKVSYKFIKKYINDIFRKKGGRDYRFGGYEGLLSIISYGLFDSVKLIEMVAYSKKSVYFDEKMIVFLKDYCILEFETAEERYKELHEKYSLDYLPRIAIHGLEEFYWFLRNQVSKETLLLIGLMDM